MPAEAPEPPADKPLATKTTAECINIVWPGTTYDGGSSVTGYKVEMCEDGTKKWTIVSKDVFSTGIAVKEIVGGKSYRFRVSCINSVGTSKPSEESEPIEAVEGSDDIAEEEPDEAAFEPRDLSVPKKINVKEEYEIREELGKGKFGTVNKCVERATKRVWAAKFIQVQKEADRKEVEHEVEIMQLLQHPKLLQLYDIYSAGQSMCLILELVSGGELFERVIDDEFDLTEKAATEFMKQICDGVAFMHTQKVLHLDMKPENILCIRKNSNKIKIIDFGLAQVYKPGLSVSCGTPEFYAPEIVTFDPVSYTTDMWSVGVICYILLSGFSPFMGDNEGETLSNIQECEWDFDDECFDEISAMAKDFIENLLTIEQDERLEATDCLEHDWLKSEIAAGKGLSKGRLKKYVIKKRWLKAFNAVRAMIRVKCVI